MVERTINVSHPVGLNDVRRIMEAAREMTCDEQLIVSMSNLDADRAGNIFSVLKENNFEWSTRGGHDGTNYYIISKKK